MQIVVIAGGKGTRLSEHTRGLPKPMIEIGNKPLLEHQILLGKKYGFTTFLFLTGFGAEHIEKYFGDGSRWSVQIRYRRESQPLGTAGAVLGAFELLDETFFVLYGDAMLNVDLARMAAAHKADASATLFVHPNDHPQDSDLVELDTSGRVVAFHPYPHPSHCYFSNLVNAALYVISKASLAPFRPASHAIDFAKELFPEMLKRQANLYGYRSREYIKDAGTPARLEGVRSDYSAGRIQSSSLENPSPAVFLDRDGTLNVDKRWLNSPDQLELLPGAARAVRRINESGYLAVLVTNQPVIARGECTDAQLAQIHSRLEWMLSEEHAYLDAIYYCPHHPDKGYPGERPALKTACLCRKPAPGLLELAAKELNIDHAQSWMIGDSSADIEAAHAFGIRSILLRNKDSSPYSGALQPDAEFETLLEAVEFLASRSQTRI